MMVIRKIPDQKIVMCERYVLRCWKQEDGEPLISFVPRQREKAASCEDGALRDEMI